MGLIFSGEVEINYLTLGYFPDGLQLEFSGEAGTRNSIDGNFIFTGSGELNLLGESDSNIVKYNYISEGDLSFSGEAEIDSDWIGLFEIHGGMSGFADNLEVFFAEDLQVTNSIISSATTIYNTCGCNVIPSILYLSNNLEFGGVLNEYLVRNGINLPDYISLFYDGRYGSWRNSIFLTGVGDNLNSQENWNLIFEWACVNEYSEESFNSSVWKFSLLVSRKNLGFNVDFDTRILILFSSSQICLDANLFDFDFNFKVNTRDKFVKTNNNLIVDVLTFHDEIGIFRSKHFLSNEFKIKISEHKLGSDIEIIGLNSLIPERQPQFIV